MCMYTYIYTYLYIYICTFTYAYMHVHICVSLVHEDRSRESDSGDDSITGQIVYVYMVQGCVWYICTWFICTWFRVVFCVCVLTKNQLRFALR